MEVEIEGGANEEISFRTMLDVWKNGGNRIYSEIDPDESLGCPLRKIYLGQTKGGGKRNLAVKGGKQ